MMSERKQYIDFIKAIGIILVIIGHINFANSVVKEYIYSFHMPLFFFAAGFVVRKHDGFGFIEKRFKQLMIPYFVWAFVYAGLTPRNIVYVIYGSYKTITKTDGLTSLWFFPVMFLSGIIVQLLLKKISNSKVLLLCGVGLLISSVSIPTIPYGYPWCVDVALIASFFTIVGIAVAQINLKSIQRLYILVLLGISMQVVVFVFPNSSIEYVLLANRTIGNPFLFLLSSLGGCSLVLGTSKLFELKENWLTRTLSIVGKNTLGILMVHKPIIAIFEIVFKIISCPTIVQLTITTLCVLPISCILSILIHRLAPNIIGKVI